MSGNQQQNQKGGQQAKDGLSLASNYSAANASLGSMLPTLIGGVSNAVGFAFAIPVAFITSVGLWKLAGKFGQQRPEDPAERHQRMQQQYQQNNNKQNNNNNNQQKVPQQKQVETKNESDVIIDAVTVHTTATTEDGKTLTGPPAIITGDDTKA